MQDGDISYAVGFRAFAIWARRAHKIFTLVILKVFARRVGDLICMPIGLVVKAI
jgi:hypothetical protein